MFKKLLKDSAIFSLVNVAEKGVGLALFPILAHRIHVADYGRYDLLLITVGVLIILGGGELFQGLMRLLPEKKEREAVEFASTALWSSLFGVSVLVVIILLCRQHFSVLIFDDVESAGLLLWLSSLMVLQCACGILITVLRVNFRAAAIAGGSILRLGINVGVTLLAVCWWSWGVYGILLGQVVSLSVLFLYLLWKSKSFIAITWHAEHFKALLTFSFPLIFGSLAVVASQQGDRYVTAGFLGVADVGILGTGYRIASIITLIQGGIAMALTPLIYEHHTEAATPARLATLFRFYVMACVALIAFFVFFGKLIVSTLLPLEYQESSIILPIIIASQALSQAYLFFPGLALAKKTVLLSSHRIISLLFQFLVVVFAVVQFGLLGMCIASFITQLISFAVFVYFSQKSYLVPVHFSKIFIFVLSVSVICVAYLSFYQECISFGAISVFILAVLAAPFISGACKYSELSQTVYVVKKWLGNKV
jgi:O-antigen/teichoic acid export membrane protein